MILAEILAQKKIVIPDHLNESNRLFTFLNPVSYLIARKHIKLYSAFDYKLSDGWFFVAALRVFGIKTPRYSFDMTSLAPEVFRKAIDKNHSVYFIGAKADEIISFIAVVKTHYPDLNVVGYRDGFFKNNEERSDAIKNILELSPKIVIAGLGVPLQEKFLIDLKSNGWRGCGYTCGGFIHQTSSQILYYPTWVNNLHLRMPYRFFNEPHFRSRLPDYFKFIFIFIYDCYKFKSTQG